MNELHLLTLIYFLTGSLFNLAGIYTLALNKKSSANRIFFTMMMVLSVWAWFYKNSITADTSILALYYWRASVIGWGTFYSLFYHFIDTLEKGERRHSLRFYLFVYLPALLNILIYGFLGDNNELVKYITLTKFGWNRLKLLGAISPYFYVYYLAFFIIGIYKLYGWKRKIRDPKMKKKLIYISSLFIFGFFAGTISDVSGLAQMELPQIGIVILLIPFIVIFNSIRQRQILADPIEIESDLIASNTLMKRLIMLTGYIYITTAFTLYALDYFFLDMSLMDALLFSALLYMTGILHLLAFDKINKLNWQYSVLTFSTLLLTLIIRMRYEYSDGATAWAVVFYSLIVTTIFDKKIYSYISYTIILFMQFYYLYTHQSYTIYIGRINQLGNIILIIACIILIRFINKNFRKRIKLSSQQLAIQDFLTEASNKLLAIDKQNEEQMIDKILEDSLLPLGASKIYLVRLLINDKNIVITNKADRNATKTDLEITKEVGEEIFQLIQKFLGAKNTIYINAIEKLPERAFNTKDILRRKGVKALVAAPLVIGENLVGTIIQVYPNALDNERDMQYTTMIANIIGEAKRKLIYENTLYQNANFDEITNLPNRHHFSELVEQKIVSPISSILSIIFIDIDNFKDINDAFGHHIGDEVLKAVSKKLLAIVEDEGVISRFGGDEFVIMHEEIANRTEARYFINQIFKAFENPIEVGKYDFRISMSVGIALYPEDGLNINDLIKNADLAMYEAKQAGKNRFAFCEDMTKKQAMENILYTNKLFNALKNDEFIIHLQPQISAVDESVVGAEVLLRWNSPDFGLIPPFKFIPILEQTGLIIPVGTWVIEQTLDLLKSFKAEGKDLFRISVNLSSVQFQDSLLVDTVKQNLINSGIEAKYLELEITESVAVNDTEMSLDKLYQIKEIGCPIAIDDFGVEFSSLNRLQKMPIDRLKIDKSFVDGIGIDEKKETIADIIIKLTKSLKLHSIAEGVETKEQLEFLREHGCEEIQGYYFAKPMPVNEFIDFVDNHEVSK